jgi:glutaredoxin
MLTVYTLPNCPSCVTLKDKLKKYNVSFNEQVIGRDVTREDVFSKFPGVKTAPIVESDGARMTNESVDEYLKGRLLLEG